jgi:hypothetical protein
MHSRGLSIALVTAVPQRRDAADVGDARPAIANARDVIAALPQKRCSGQLWTPVKSRCVMVT